MVRHSPFRRRQLSDVAAFAGLYETARPRQPEPSGTREAFDRCRVAWARCAGCVDLIDRLAAMCRLMANALEQHRLPTAAKDRLRPLALDSSRVELSDSLDPVVILAQTRSMIVDLLELTGVGYLEARELIPELTE